ncbi:MAG: cell division protein FtsZ [Lachnospiraceae bacterium]|nr:cell division protein FtsZ [Lachnospiraceae bacterium]MDD7146869.1 cell division protein FtsZ [Lachnospiraceae bacterium]MDY4070361.1 cell division protein FtsZ [Lachnospiraceae bacterium]
MLEIKCDNVAGGPRIMVIGVGGGGNNALDRMINSQLPGVNYVAVNTDSQVLDACKAETRIQIGKKITKGYGAGADPEIGEAAAAENEEEIKATIEGSNMCIITCGMGGGTGTGAAPVIAKWCKDAGILTVAVVTTPFSFESMPRITAAQNGVQKLKANVDTLLVIPNDKLIGLSEKPLLLEAAFEIADSVLKYTIEGITNIICNRGIVNLDFNDLRTTLLNKGIGHLGIGTVDVESSVLEAVKQAVNSPLLETSIGGAENLLINTSGKVDIASLNEAINYVRELAGNKVNIIWGTVTKEGFEEDKIVVTLIATGMPDIPKLPRMTQKTGKREVTFRNEIQLAPVKGNQVKELEIIVPPFLQEAGKKGERK